MLGRESMLTPLLDGQGSMAQAFASVSAWQSLSVAFFHMSSCFCLAERVHAAGEGSFLQRFFSATADMDPAQRGAYLEHPPEGAPDIDEAHHVSHRT